MDSTGDEDLKLQRASAHLIADLQRSLPRLLYKDISTQSSHPSIANGIVRVLVLENKTDQLIKLVGPSHHVRCAFNLLISIVSSSWSHFKNGPSC